MDRAAWWAAPWGRKELYVTEATEHTHTSTHRRKYTQVVRMSLRRWRYRGRLSLLFIFYNSIRKVNHKCTCCCCIINIQVPPNSKTTLPHQRVALLGLIREPPGLDPPVQALPGSAPLQAEGRTAVCGWVGGLCCGQTVGLGKGWAVTGPQQDREEKQNHSQDPQAPTCRRHHERHPPYMPPDTAFRGWDYGWSLIVYFNFFNVKFSQLNK